VRDFHTKKELYEIYTYGEQVVVMAIEGEKAKNSVEKLAERQLRSIIERYIDGRVEVKMKSNNSAVVYVEERNISHIIGKAGKTISRIEEEAGMKLNVQPMSSPSESEITPSIFKRKNYIVIQAGRQYGGREADIIADGRIILSGSLSPQGTLKISRKSKHGKEIVNAIASNSDVVVKIR